MAGAFLMNWRLVCVTGNTGCRSPYKPQSFKQSGKPGGFLFHGRQASAQTSRYGKYQSRQDNADSDNGEDDRRCVAFHDGPFHAPARPLSPYAIPPGPSNSRFFWFRVLEIVHSDQGEQLETAHMSIPALIIMLKIAMSKVAMVM